MTTENFEEETSGLMDAEGLKKAKLNDSKIMHKRNPQEGSSNIRNQIREQPSSLTGLPDVLQNTENLN